MGSLRGEREMARSRALKNVVRVHVTPVSELLKAVEMFSSDEVGAEAWRG